MNPYQTLSLVAGFLNRRARAVPYVPPTPDMLVGWARLLGTPVDGVCGNCGGRIAEGTFHVAGTGGASHVCEVVET